MRSDGAGERGHYGDVEVSIDTPEPSLVLHSRLLWLWSEWHTWLLARSWSWLTKQSLKEFCEFSFHESLIHRGWIWKCPDLRHGTVMTVHRSASFCHSLLWWHLCGWTMLLSPPLPRATRWQRILKTKLASAEVFRGLNNGLTDVICSPCRQNTLLVHDPKQTKAWNGTAPQDGSSGLWQLETNAAWQWYAASAIDDPVCSKCWVTVKQAFVCLDSCRSTLEGGERHSLTAGGHSHLRLVAEYCLCPWWWKVFVVAVVFLKTSSPSLRVLNPGFALVWVFLAFCSRLILIMPEANKIVYSALL